MVLPYYLFIDLDILCVVFVMVVYLSYLRRMWDMVYVVCLFMICLLVHVACGRSVSVEVLRRVHTLLLI